MPERVAEPRRPEKKQISASAAVGWWPKIRSARLPLDSIEPRLLDPEAQDTKTKLASWTMYCRGNRYRMWQEPTGGARS